MNALRQLLNKLTEGAPLSGDDLIALALLLTMVASLAHLLTMLATHGVIVISHSSRCWHQS